MRLSEVEYMTDSKVEVKDTISGSKCASLSRCEIKDGAILSSACAFAETAREARKALAERLSGQTLVKNAYSDRMTWKLPKVSV